MADAGRSKRLVIEAFVIVGSILLAFAIDAAWDERQEHEAAAELARDMIADLDLSLENLRVSREGNQRKLDAAIGLREALREEAPPISMDSVSTLLLTSQAVWRLSPVNRSYDQLVATGLLRLLEPDVRDGLSTWRQRQDNTREYHERDLLEFRQTTAFPFFIESEIAFEQVLTGDFYGLDLGTPRFPHTWQVLRESRGLTDLLAMTSVAAASVLFEYDELQGEASMLRELLEGYYGT